MGKEIERKYLIGNDSWREGAYGTTYRQGYLSTVKERTGRVRIINEKGKDVELHRLRSASIGEQIRLMRYFGKKKLDVLIMECMAVNPQYQWLSEQKIVKSTIGVLTNVRPDHLDEMGISMNQIT